jgi:hypothetical protein
MLYINLFRFINRESCQTNSTLLTQENSERTPEDAEFASMPEVSFRSTIYRCAESASEREHLSSDSTSINMNYEDEIFVSRFFINSFIMAVHGTLAKAGKVRK